MVDFTRKLGQLKSLSAWQWRVLLGSKFILPLTWLHLHRRGYKSSLKWVRTPEPSRSGLAPEEQLSLARQTAFAMDVAIKYGFWKPKCLVRSLALGWFLKRRGLVYQIKVGVPGAEGSANGAEPGDFTAHAWVEYCGNVLNDRENISDEYIPFDTGSGPA